MPKFLLILLLFTGFTTAAQVPQRLPEGYFLQDSVKIGELLPYVLVHRHAITQEVVFPDSAYNFSPFELVSKTYYPTRSDSTTSLDSTIYLLRTFELEKVQKLSLPVYILRGTDTLSLFTTADSVILHELVTQVQEPLALQQNTELAYVKERFNYPFLAIGISTAVLLLLLVWVIFGRNLKMRYRLYKLGKDYRTFLSRFQAHLLRYNRSGAINNVENAVSLWKNYLTRLEKMPINSYTTKELVAFYNDDEQVNQSLRQCDRAIYGNISNAQPEEMQAALHELKQFAAARYETIKEELRHV